MFGWFVPPVTTRYKFYLQCGSNCVMRHGDYPNQREHKHQTGRVGSYGPYDTFMNFGRAAESTSEWMNMTKGEHYYFEAYHTDNNVWEHLEVAVEIEAVDPPVAEEGEE